MKSCQPIDGSSNYSAKLVNSGCPGLFERSPDASGYESVRGLSPPGLPQTVTYHEDRHAERGFVPLDGNFSIR
jgi:hypothetical protein